MYIVVGTTTVDLFVSGLEQIPRVSGDEFTTNSLAFCANPLLKVLGGNGANSAYVLAKLGAPVSLVSACGQDEMGALVVRWLQGPGVDLQALVRHPQLATATTTVVTDNDFNRLAFHHPGASHGFGPDDVSDALLERATTLLVTGYSLMPRFRGTGYARLLSAAKRAGIVTALDIGPAIAQPVQLEELAPLLPALDYLLCNEHELEACVDEHSLHENVDRMLAAGTRCLVLKRGPAGASAWHEDRHVDVPGFAIEAKFTVGAGDSFNAGFLFSIGAGATLTTALNFANGTAALVVAGSQGVLDAPTLAQVEELLQKKGVTG